MVPVMAKTTDVKKQKLSYVVVGQNNHLLNKIVVT